MGILDNFTNALGLSGGSESADVHEYLNDEDLENLEEEEEEAAAYVKPLTIESNQSIREIKDELNNGNLVLLNVSNLLKNEQTLVQVVNHLKDYVRSIKGDIARLDNEKILLTPSRIKIVKRRR